MPLRTPGSPSGRPPRGASATRPRAGSGPLPALLCLLVAASSAGARADGSPPALALDPDACPFEVPEAIGRNVECGTLVVPASRGARAPGEFELPVAVFRSAAEAPALEPVVFLPGGPGESLFPGAVVDLAAFLDRAAPDRDLVFYDQRGTGPAASLDCPEFERTVSSYRGPADEAYAARLARLLGACMAALEERTAYPLATLNSGEHLADVEALRRALGVERWNVAASSYGAKLALLLLREHAPSVRALAVGSVRLPGDITPIDQHGSFRAAIRRVASACAADPACREAYGDVAALHERAYAVLEAEPLALAEAGRVEPLVVDGGRLTLALWDLLNAPRFIQSVPMLLDAAARRDAAWLRGAFGVVAPKDGPKDGPDDGPDDGGGSPATDHGSTRADPGVPAAAPLSTPVFTAYMCNEEIPFATRERMAAALHGHAPVAAFFRVRPSNGTALYDVCPGIETLDPVPDALNRAVAAPLAPAVPALVLAGAYDPNTRPANARRAAGALERSRLVVFPTGTHGAGFASECAATILADFLTAPGRFVARKRPDEASGAAGVAGTACVDDGEVVFATPRVARRVERALAGSDASTRVPAGWTELLPGRFARSAARLATLYALRAVDADAALEFAGAGREGARVEDLGPAALGLDAATLPGGTALHRIEQDDGRTTWLATFAPERGHEGAPTFLVALSLAPALAGTPVGDGPGYVDDAFVPAVRRFARDSGTKTE